MTLVIIPAIIISGDSIICNGSTTQFTAPSIENVIYSWTGPNNFSSNEQNPFIQATSFLQTGLYQLTVELFGCNSDTSSFELNVIDCDTLDFFIPEGFSPNSDGVNDLFVIRGIQAFPSNDFVIYNRWGDKVFEQHAYDNTWDGTSSFGLILGSDLLPVGTYFYILKLNDGTKAIKGTIYLNR